MDSTWFAMLREYGFSNKDIERLDQLGYAIAQAHIISVGEARWRIIEQAKRGLAVWQIENEVWKM